MIVALRHLVMVEVGDRLSVAERDLETEPVALGHFEDEGEELGHKEEDGDCVSDRESLTEPLVLGDCVSDKEPRGLLVAEGEALKHIENVNIKVRDPADDAL